MPVNPIFRYTRSYVVVPLSPFEHIVVRGLNYATRHNDASWLRGILHATRCLFEHTQREMCSGALLDTLVPILVRKCECSVLLQALDRIDTREFDDGLYGEDAFSLCTFYSAATLAAARQETPQTDGNDGN